jgi:hypothetical protein
MARSCLRRSVKYWATDAGRDLEIRILSQQFKEGEDGERRLSHGEERPPKKSKVLGD